MEYFDKLVAADQRATERLNAAKRAFDVAFSADQSDPNYDTNLAAAK
jgi:hypothetical protein